MNIKPSTTLAKKILKKLPSFFPMGTVDAVTNCGRLDFPAYEACLFEYFQVLGHGGVGDRQLLGDIPSEAATLFFQEPEYEHACRVAEGFGIQGEFFFGFCVWFFVLHIVILRIFKSPDGYGCI